MKQTRNMLSRFLRTAALFLIIASLTACASSRPLAAAGHADIDTVTVHIPGISREYSLLFLTDMHIVVPGESADGRLQDYASERLSHFTDETGHVSSELFASWMDYANQTEPDALLLGGDIIDSPAPSNLEYLGQSLGKLKVPYLYAVGNHDWTYPWEYMTETGTESYLPLLSPYMDSNTAIHSLELDDFIIVAVDNSNNQIHPDALEEYRSILTRNKPVILLLHVPFYTEELLAEASAVWPNSVVLGGGVHGGIYPNDVSAQFMSLTTAADSPVAAVLAGHIHFSNVSSLAGEKNVPQIVGDAGYKGKATLIRITADLETP